jgi:hypothetical protein
VAAADLAFQSSVDPDDALVAVWPLGLVRSDDPRALASLATASPPLLTETPDGVAAIASGGEGFDVLATIELAVIEIGAGRRRGLDRLRWLLDTAPPTWTLPTFVHPRLRSGSAGDGCDPVAAAGLLLLIRQLLVRETPDGLALVSLLPETWLGQGLEVHEAPTPHGLLSYAVRWHGDRPALLWEISARDAAPAPVLTAPGLDAAWSSTELSGEALLAPVPVPAPATRVGLSPRRR